MNYDIAKEWLNRGKNETEIVYRFICFYIAFNSLYDQEKQRWEYERVSSFIKKYMERNPFYNPSSLMHSKEWSKDIKNVRDGNVKSYIRNESTQKNKLFMSIYQIRCNLFHGSKSMYYKRNVDLIQDSANILEDLLTRIITKESQGETNAS